MYLIGIAGGSGSGKTTFARKVLAYAQEALGGLGSESVSKLTCGVGILHQDSYYVASAPEALRSEKGYNFDHPAAFDWDLLCDHLKRLKTGQAVDVPTYDYHTNSRRSEVEVMGPCHTVLFEGIYALWEPRLRDLLDLKVYLNVDADIRLIRRLHRDVRERGRTLDSIVSQYYDTVRPMHHEHLEPTRQFANLIVGEDTDVAARVLAAQIVEVVSRLPAQGTQHGLRLQSALPTLKRSEIVA